MDEHDKEQLLIFSWKSLCVLSVLWVAGFLETMLGLLGGWIGFLIEGHIGAIIITAVLLLGSWKAVNDSDDPISEIFVIGLFLFAILFCGAIFVNCIAN